MSVKVMAEVWALDLPQNEKLVLLAFADHADDDGVCRPSIGRVAWKTGYSESQVQRIGKRLRERGLMEPIGIFDLKSGKVFVGDKPNRGQLLLYQVFAEKGRKLRPFGGEKGRIGGPQGSHGGRDKGRIAMTPESSVEPSENQKIGAANAAQPKKRSAQLPENFTLTAEMEQFARERHIADIGEEFHKFTDFHRAKGSVFRDWLAAWRNWVRNCQKFNPNAAPQPNLLAEKERLEKKYGIH